MSKSTTTSNYTVTKVNLDDRREQRFEQALIYASQVCGYPASYDLEYYGDSASEFISKYYAPRSLDYEF